MYTFATHLLFVKILYKCVILHNICLFSKQGVKAAITAFAPAANTVLNMKFAMKQTWSKLGKFGLYTIFATDLLPAKIIFFRPVLQHNKAKYYGGKPDKPPSYCPSRGAHVSI